MSNHDTGSMREALEQLRHTSVSSSGSGNSPCTVDDLQRLRNSLVLVLDVIIKNLEN